MSLISIQRSHLRWPVSFDDIFQYNAMKSFSPTPASAFFTICLLVGSIVFVSACTSTSSTNTIHEGMEESASSLPDDVNVLDADEIHSAPEPVGGMQTLYEEVTYPQGARRRGEVGRVVVQFVVGPDGTIYEPEVVNSATRTLDAEAMRVVHALDWEPGVHNDDPVYANLELPVSFSIM